MRLYNFCLPCLSQVVPDLTLSEGEKASNLSIMPCHRCSASPAYLISIGDGKVSIRKGHDAECRCLRCVETKGPILL